MSRAARLREYEVDVRPGVTLTMKLSPEKVAERGDSKRVREVKARSAVNKGRQPANKSASAGG